MNRRILAFAVFACSLCPLIFADPRNADAQSGKYPVGHTPAQMDALIEAQARKDFPALQAKAEQGDSNAQYDMGLSYMQGLGVSRDIAEALNWFRKSADQGNILAQLQLGDLYAGRGGYKTEDAPRDYVESAKWYRKAADQGLAEARLKLSDKNQIVAEWGLGEAQFKLGNAYRDGEGVPKDIVMACLWYSLAASEDKAVGYSGNPRPMASITANYNFFTLNKQLSAEQKTQIAKMAQDWKTRHGMNP